MDCRLGVLSFGFKVVCLAFLGQSLCCQAALGQDSEFTIGFPAIGRGLNILESTHPAALVLKAGLTRGLTVRTGDENVHSYRLDLSDNMSVSADYLRWSFRLKPALRFHNGKDLRAEDVRFSLLRCAKGGVFPLKLNDVSVRLVPPDSQSAREWVDAVVESAGIPQERLRDFPSALAQCPILERESAALFDKDLGVGTNLISIGDYAISGFKSNGEYELTRFSARTLAEDTGSRVTIRPFDDGLRAVSALRGGTIDALFISGEQELKAAAEDGTLVIGKCLDFQVLKRRGLEFPCDGTVSLSSMRYKS